MVGAKNGALGLLGVDGPNIKDSTSWLILTA